MNRTVRNGLAVATMAGGIWLLGQAVASADVTASSESVGDGTAVTTVDAPTTGGDAYAEGHVVVNETSQSASSEGNGGAANSGNSVETGVANVHSDDNGNASTSSGSASVSNSGGNASNTNAGTEVSGTTTATGGNATGGDVSGSSEAVGVSGGGGGGADIAATSSSSGSSGGGGAATVVDAPTTGGSAGAIGHTVITETEQEAISGGNAGEANSGNSVVVFCFNYKSHSNCSPVTSSGSASVTNTGGNASNTNGPTVVSGNTTATGGSASGGSVSGTSESVDLGSFFEWLSGFMSGSTGPSATTEVDGSTEGGDAQAYGHYVVNATEQFAYSGGNEGYANSGNAVYVFCFNFKSDDNCNPHTTSGNAAVSNTGGNASNTNAGTSVSGTTSATGGNANGGSVSGTSEAVGTGSGSGSGGAYTGVGAPVTGGSAGAAGHEVYTGTWQQALSGGNYGVANSGNHVVVYCFNYKSNNNCNPVTTSGSATVTNDGGNATNSNGPTVVSGCTSAVGGSANAASASGGCATEAPAQPGTPAEPTHPATPAAPAPAAPVAAPVQHVAPVVTGSGAHAVTVSSASSSPATLAYTGADVEDALGLGLLALAGGLGLALAGRRRSAA